MKTCAVATCGYDSNKRPDLSFFNIPKDPYLREEWLEVLGVKRKENINSLAVCELHFKEKDFKAGKKELKTLVVPVLKLGKYDPFDSDEDFIAYDSENDPEIFEMQGEILSAVKQEPIEETPQPDPATDLELETGRRPSRRAALVAAKKIFNTVRNFSVSDNPPDPVPNPKPVSTSHPYTRPKPKKIPPVNVDLQMDCCDDFLSPIQAEFLLKAQMQYNMVMKNLRELMAYNVKVIQTDANGIPTAVTSASSINLKSGNVAITSKSARNKLVKTGSAVVVPITLTQSPIL